MAVDDKKTQSPEARKYAQDREKQSKEQAEQRASMQGTPTPTQEEADLAKLGLYPDLAPDGSTDPCAPPATKQATAEHSGGGYTTRQAHPKTPASSS